MADLASPIEEHEEDQSETNAATAHNYYGEEKAIRNLVETHPYRLFKWCDRFLDGGRDPLYHFCAKDSPFRSAPRAIRCSYVLLIFAYAKNKRFVRMRG